MTPRLLRSSGLRSQRTRQAHLSYKFDRAIVQLRALEQRVLPATGTISSFVIDPIIEPGQSIHVAWKISGLSVAEINSLDSTATIKVSLKDVENQLQTNTIKIGTDDDDNSFIITDGAGAHLKGFSVLPPPSNTVPGTNYQVVTSAQGSGFTFTAPANLQGTARYSIDSTSPDVAPVSQFEQRGLGISSQLDIYSSYLTSGTSVTSDLSNFLRAELAAQEVRNANAVRDTLGSNINLLNSRLPQFLDDAFEGEVNVHVPNVPGISTIWDASKPTVVLIHGANGAFPYFYSLGHGFQRLSNEW